MNTLDGDRRVQVARHLIDGKSLQTTAVLTGVAKNTVAKLLADVGKSCTIYQDKHLSNLRCRRLQCNEVWSFGETKQKNVPVEQAGRGHSDVWTWTAIDTDTKLVPCWMVGQRGLATAAEFIGDLAKRLSHNVQLITNDRRSLVEVVATGESEDLDLAKLAKIYGASRQEQGRYFPSLTNGAEPKGYMPTPELGDIGADPVKQRNLIMPMSMNALSHLTGISPKRVENHMAAIALHFMYHNFAKVDQSNRTTPAMAAGVTARPWDINDIIKLADST